MNILMVMPFSPVPANFGGAQRMLHLARQVAQRHALHLVFPGAPTDAAWAQQETGAREVSAVQRTWRGRHRRLAQLMSLASPRSHFESDVQSDALERVVAGALAARRYDLLHVEFSHVGPFSAPSDVVRVLDAHNVEFDNFRSMAEVASSPWMQRWYAHEARRLRAGELGRIAQQDLLLVTSALDAERYRRAGVEVPMAVIPNGVSVRPARQPDRTVSGEEVLFVGTMDYTPNHDGVAWFVRDIWPRIARARPGARFTVVGRNPPAHIRALESQGVQVTGTVPDVGRYLERAAVVVVPLRMGGGTRLKIAEALEAGKAVVSTRLGAEGIPVQHGVDILIADEPESFSGRVAELLGAPTERARLGAAGRHLVERVLDWNVMGAQLEAAYQEAFARKQAAGMKSTKQRD